MRAKQILLLVSLAVASLRPIPGAESPASPDAPTAEAAIDAELKALVERVNTRLRAGPATADDLAGELQEFDALLARHAGNKSDEAAQILLLKAMLYVQVFEDFTQGEALLTRIATEFPDTETAARLPRIQEQIKEASDAARTLAALIGQPAPELHFEWANREGLTSLADLKGKVVILDFWATWCGPCIRSFPEMRELTAHYTGRSVEVVGVTSLQGEVHGLSAQPIACAGDPAKEQSLMGQFIQKKNITWTVAFSTEPVFNPAWGVRGIPYVAIVAPDGTVRHAGLHPAAPLAEKTAKIDALLAEFDLDRATGG